MENISVLLWVIGYSFILSQLIMAMVDDSPEARRRARRSRELGC